MNDMNWAWIMWVMVSLRRFHYQSFAIKNQYEFRHIDVGIRKYKLYVPIWFWLIPLCLRSVPRRRTEFEMDHNNNNNNNNLRCLNLLPFVTTTLVVLDNSDIKTDCMWTRLIHLHCCFIFHCDWWFLTRYHHYIRSCNNKFGIIHVLYVALAIRFQLE